MVTPKQIAETVSEENRASPQMIDYTENWRSYKKARNLWLFVFLGYLPGVYALTSLFSRVFHQEMDTLMAPIALVWMAAFGFVSWNLGHWPCPRCGKSFFESRMFRNPLARECSHCKLPKYANHIGS